MPTNFRETWLWQQAFVATRADANIDEQKYFEQLYLSLREKAAVLVAGIPKDVPGLTIHDISHLDALWDMASLVTDGQFSLSPPEAFVLGGAILLHDAGMTLAAYPNGISDLEKTILWKDIAATAEKNNPNVDPKTYEKELIAEVLRRLHAERAAELPLQEFYFKGGDAQFLIDDPNVRSFYGPSIGTIAHSHWWSIGRLETDMQPSLGAFPPFTRCSVDKLKIAGLLRVADALHLDRRRAPSFSKILTAPKDLSAAHWSFQEKFAAPILEDDAVVFTSSQSFDLNEADAWWLAYDAICVADRELRDVDLLFREANGLKLRAVRAKGAGSPSHFAKIVPTKNWTPVESKIHISDVPKIVEVFGGAKLYGDDPMVAIRELIQNARDAIDARRKRQGRPANWGAIKVDSFERDGPWLSVEDNGLGMSERVLTGPLIDFGSSLWSSPQLNEEFPGLAASNIHPVGRFGIGFFSVFMLGQVIRVVTRRYDRGDKDALVLEFRNGLNSRPILYSAMNGEAPVDGGTRIEILLRDHTVISDTLKDMYGQRLPEFSRRVGALAPMLDVAIDVRSKHVVKANDWLRVSPQTIANRFLPFLGGDSSGALDFIKKATLPIKTKAGEIVGRACIYPTSFYSAKGVVTVGGLSAAAAQNFIGAIEGEPSTVARDEAVLPTAELDLASWAAGQVDILQKMKVEPSKQAEIAEIVLECGGDPGGLKFARIGPNWYSQRQLAAYLKKISAFSMYCGHLMHSDSDPVTVGNFDAGFEIKKDLIFIPDYDGRILSFKRSNNFNFRGYAPPAKRLEGLFNAIVSKVWGDHSVDDQYVKVGEVHGEDISRLGYRYKK